MCENPTSLPPGLGLSPVCPSATLRFLSHQQSLVPHRWEELRASAQQIYHASGLGRIELKGGGDEETEVLVHAPVPRSPKLARPPGLAVTQDVRWAVSTE